MTVYLRPFNPDADSARMAELLSLAGRGRRFMHGAPRRQSQATGHVLYRVIAVESDERLVGFAETDREEWMLPGHYWIAVVVAPEARRQGIGTMLLDDVLEFAWEQGATRLLAQVDAGDREAACFARAHGFAIHELLASRSLAGFGAADYDPGDRAALPAVCFELDLVACAS